MTTRQAVARLALSHVLGAACVVALAVPARAQLAGGDTLRTFVGHTEVLRGTYLGAGDGALYVKRLGMPDTVRLVPGDASRIERYLGRTRGGSRIVWRSIGAGILVGIAGGAVSDAQGPARDASGLAGTLALGALLGGLTGLAVGEVASGVKVERWEPVDPWVTGPRVVAVAPALPVTHPDTLAPFVPAPARAGLRDPMVVGAQDTVRLFSGKVELIRGTLVAVDSAGFVVLGEDAIVPVRHSRTYVDHALVRRGEVKRGAAAVAKGALVGAGAGALWIGATSGSNNSGDLGKGLEVFFSVLGVTLTTLAGAGVGAIASQTYAAQWLPFDPATLRVLAPDRSP